MLSPPSRRIRGQTGGGGATLSVPTAETGQSVTMESAPSTPSAPVTMDTEEGAAEGAAEGTPAEGAVTRNPRLQQLRALLKSHLETFHEKIRDRRTELVELTGEDFAAGLKKVRGGGGCVGGGG